MMRVLLLVLSLSMFGSGCAAALAALPVITSAAVTAGQVLDAIESFLEANNVRDAKVDRALVKVRAALVTVQHAAKGAEDIHDGDLQAALDDFQIAYTALLDVVAPYGVHPPATAGLFGAQPKSDNTLVVPEPLKMRAEFQ